MSRALAIVRAHRRTTALGLALAVALVSAVSTMAPGPAAVLSPSTRDRVQDVGPILPIPPPPEEDPVRTALGQGLFFDRRLSRGNDRSCESCHDLGTNGASVNGKDQTPAGKPDTRNTPTVFNSGLSFRLDWEGDARSLEEQAERALFSPEFMDEDWPDVLSKLGSDRDLVGRFRRAYGRGPDRADVLDAIARFEETLVTPSRFDLWLRGNPAALSSEEIAGYKIFQAVGCAACHQGVNVGGNLFERVGVFAPLLGKPRETLRVPSLRNVAVTPPYFDDASAATLPEAVKQMARAQLGRELTPEQNAMIVAFLGSLTGTYRGHQLAAPR